MEKYAEVRLSIFLEIEKEEREWGYQKAQAMNDGGMEGYNSYMKREGKKSHKLLKMSRVTTKKIFDKALDAYVEHYGYGSKSYYYTSSFAVDSNKQAEIRAERIVNRGAMRKLASSEGKRFVITISPLEIVGVDNVKTKDFDTGLHEVEKIYSLSEINGFVEDHFLKIKDNMRVSKDKVVQEKKKIDPYPKYDPFAAPPWEQRRTPHSQVKVEGVLYTKLGLHYSYRYVVTGLNLDSKNLVKVLKLGLKKVHFSD